MICHNCKKRIATIFVTHVANDNKQELCLCQQCAVEMGKLALGIPYNLSFSDFLAGVIGKEDDNAEGQEKLSDDAGTLESGAQIAGPVASCSVCGMTYEDFQKTGKIGCSNCYESFGDRMKDILKRLHGNTLHSGKVPAAKELLVAADRALEEVRVLKNDLHLAIQKEEYEKAAELRDKIRYLESR